MKVLTWNVNGIRAREAQVWELAKVDQPDVICLQELKAATDAVPKSLFELDGYWCGWHGLKGYSGVALLLRKATFTHAPKYGHPDFDLEARVITAEVGPWVFASIYVPNGGKGYEPKVLFLEEMARWVRALHAKGKQVILCGDLNVALETRDVHPKLQNPTQIGQTPEEQHLLRNILDGGVVDLLRSFSPEDDNLFTWWAPWRNQRERNIGWRLDYVLPSTELAKSAKACAVYRERGTSDHGPVIASFELSPPAVEGDAPLELPPQTPPPRAGQLGLFDEPR